MNQTVPQIDPEFEAERRLLEAAVAEARADAYSDEAGHAFRFHSGHPFRNEAGHRSDLKPATCASFG